VNVGRHAPQPVARSANVGAEEMERREVDSFSPEVARRLLCVSHGVEALLTRGRDFSLFEELRTPNPLA
jgi:hypothetical protein